MYIIFPRPAHDRDKERRLPREPYSPAHGYAFGGDLNTHSTKRSLDKSTRCSCFNQKPLFSTHPACNVINFEQVQIGDSFHRNLLTHTLVKSNARSWICLNFEHRMCFDPRDRPAMPLGEHGLPYSKPFGIWWYS